MKSKLTENLFILSIGAILEFIVVFIAVCATMTVLKMFGVL